VPEHQDLDVLGCIRASERAAPASSADGRRADRRVARPQRRSCCAGCGPGSRGRLPEKALVRRHDTVLGTHTLAGWVNPATEQYVGRRDLTHWSRPVRAFVRVVLRISRNSSAWHVLLVTAAVGAGIALLLNWAVEEIYDSVKAADGLSSLDEPVLELAISLRTPQNVAVAQFITNLGGAIGLTMITAVIRVWMAW
jgi:hypothetical protein